MYVRFKKGGGCNSLTDSLGGGNEPKYLGAYPVYVSLLLLVVAQMLVFFFCPKASESEYVEKLLMATETKAADKLKLTVFVNPNLVDMGVTGKFCRNDDTQIQNERHLKV
jgi:hypothetical protein